ncbi:MULTISPECIES: oligosaccharide flippase family protein [unclassified Isoptericola]|uniref:oligosaccharide flippase family protein n=1 Tax=unclassified Isoptericola TaxID=2623355 RepID=UPI0036546FB6
MTTAGRPAPDETALTGKVRRASFWLGGNSIMMRLSNIAVMAVAARIVAPDEFGLFTLAVTAHAMVVTFAELGVASAIARHDLDERAVAPTGVTISVGVNVLLGGLLAYFAMPVATLLGSADAAPALRVLSVSVAMSGLFVVPAAQLQRDFRQDVVFRSNLVGTLVGAGTLVWLALVGDGALAFAWSRVGGQLVTGTLMVVALTTRYGPGWDRGSVRLLLRFGVPLALANLLSQVVVNIDYVFVGRTLELRDVGLYTLAFNVSSWASSVIASVLNGVVLPAFSTVRREGGDTGAALASAVRAVTLVSFPIAAMTAALATPLVITLYGARWSDAAPVITVLAVFGAANALGQLVANVLIACGRTVVILVVQVCALVVLVPALLAGIHQAGLLGAGTAHVVTILLVTLPVYLVVLRRALGPVLRRAARAGAWPLLSAVAAGVLAHLVAAPIPVPWLALLAGGACGGLAYLALAGRQLVALLPPGARGRIPAAWRPAPAPEPEVAR